MHKVLCNFVLKINDITVTLQDETSVVHGLTRESSSTEFAFKQLDSDILFCKCKNAWPSSCVLSIQGLFCYNDQEDISLHQSVLSTVRLQAHVLCNCLHLSADGHYWCPLLILVHQRHYLFKWLQDVSCCRNGNGVHNMDKSCLAFNYLYDSTGTVFLAPQWNLWWCRCLANPCCKTD